MIVLLMAFATLPDINDIIRRSVDPCRRIAPDEITVCADRDQRVSPYRLPLPVELEEGDMRARSISRERNDLMDFDAGGNGTCSNVGPGGGTGCNLKALKKSMQQRANARDPRGPAYDK